MITTSLEMSRHRLGGFSWGEYVNAESAASAAAAVLRQLQAHGQAIARETDAHATHSRSSGHGAHVLFVWRAGLFRSCDVVATWSLAVSRFG